MTSQTFKMPDKWQMEAKTPVEPLLFVFECGTCGFRIEDLKNPPSMITCPKCVQPKGLEIMRRCCDLPENEAGNARQKAYMETPEVQAKLKSGEWEIRKNDQR